MCDEDRRTGELAETQTEVGTHFIPELHVQRRERLVEEQCLRLGCEGTG